MILDFKYREATEKCKMLSSFEGRDYVNQDGESLFLSVKITEQDMPLLLSYMDNGARMLQERMWRMIIGAEYDTEGFSWNIRSEETRWNVNTKLAINLQEALVSYAMMHWLAERKSDRVEMYKALWEEMGAMCVQNIVRKMPPKRASRPVGDIDEVEVIVYE